MPAPTAMKWGETLLMFGFIGIGSTSVSYTHLTLPTRLMV